MKKYWKKNITLLIAVLILGAFASVLSTGISLVLQEVIDVALSQKTEAFTKLFLFTTAYTLFLCALNFLSSLASKYLTQRIIKQYRQDIFTGILHRRPDVFFKDNSSDYVSALTNDMKLVEENYITALLNTFELMVMFLVTLGLLVFLSPLVTVILVFTLLLMFLVPAGIGHILEKRQDCVSRQMSVFTGKLKEWFLGYEVLKSYHRIDHTTDRFQKENELEIRTRLQAAKLFALNEGLSDTLSVISTIAVIFVSAYLVLTGHITMGTLLALVQLSSTFMAPVLLLMQNIPKIRSMKTVIRRLNQYCVQEPKKQHGQNAPDFQQSIELQDVSFSYDDQPPVLSHITCKIERGKKYILMGQSGCGKSTLIKLLLGYFDHYRGQILYDGQELRTLDPDQIATLSCVIHQNVYLFNESIRQNILLHESFSDESLTEALQQSGVIEFLHTRENALEYIVGENGSLLSGGQRQRITLARALIRHAPLLILDEGTSALDQKTAREIENTLLNDPEITLLTITHNPHPEFLAKYDEIFYMKNGTLEKHSQTRILIRNR